MIDINDIELIIGICMNSSCRSCDFLSGMTSECVFDGFPYEWEPTEIIEIIQNIRNEENEKGWMKK